MPRITSTQIEDLEKMTNDAYLALKGTTLANGVPRLIISPADVDVTQTKYQYIKERLIDMTDSKILLYTKVPKDDGIQRYLLQYIIGNESVHMIKARMTYGNALPSPSKKIYVSVQAKKTPPVKYDNISTIKQIIDGCKDEKGYKRLEEMARELTRTEKYSYLLRAMDYVKSKFRKMYVAKELQVGKDLKDFKRNERDFFKYFKK